MGKIALTGVENGVEDLANKYDSSKSRRNVGYRDNMVRMDR